MAESLLGTRKGQRYCCKCCGYLTLQTRHVGDTPYGDSQICKVCWWEADLDEDPYRVSGPNRRTLNLGRLLFMSHGACSDHIAVYARPPRADEVPVRAEPKPRIPADRLKADVAQHLQERSEWRMRQARNNGRLFAQRLQKVLEAAETGMYEEWLALFEYHDPLQIATSRWGLTYDAQIRWLRPFLGKFASVQELRAAVHAELLRWFRPEIVGNEERYENLALDLWDSMERRAAEIHQAQEDS